MTTPATDEADLLQQAKAGDQQALATLFALIPMALAGGGSFRTLSPTAHTQANVSVVRRFLDVAIAVDMEAEDVCRITVGPK